MRSENFATNGLKRSHITEISTLLRKSGWPSPNVTSELLPEVEI